MEDFIILIFGKISEVVMKNVFCTLVLAVCFSISVYAHERQAFSVASAFVSMNFSSSGLRSAGEDPLRLVYADADVVDDASCYIYNVGERGFVIVSGQEVVGYSKEEVFDTGVIPGALRWFLEGYTDKATLASTASKSAEAVVEVVSPLLRSRWGQGFPFSNETPVVEGRSTACGCVATAMAQIMYYWEWPRQGHGEKEYVSNTHRLCLRSDFSRPFRWERMKEYYDHDGKNAPFEEVDEVSYLLRQCGIVAEMDYTTSGSGASPGTAVLGMARYFDYKITTLRSFSTYDMEEERFASLLRKELDMRRPILSAGGGHEFVCDGYDSRGYFHFDWGEYGYGNGFFKINSDHVHLRPRELSVITGILPNNVVGEAVAPVDFQSESLTLRSTPEYIGDWIEISYDYGMDILGGDTLEYGMARIEPSTNEVLEVYGIERILPLVSYSSYNHRFKVLEPAAAKAVYTFTPVKKGKEGWLVISPDKRISVELSPRELTPVELAGYCSIGGTKTVFENQVSTFSVDIANNGMTPYLGFIKIEFIDASGKVYDRIESDLSGSDNSSQNDNQFAVSYAFRKAGEYTCKVSVKDQGRLVELESADIINVVERRSVPVISSAKINTSLSMKAGFGNGIYEEIRGNEFSGAFVLRNDGEKNIEGDFVLYGSGVLYSKRVRIPVGSSETISFRVKAYEGNADWMSLTPHWQTGEGMDYDLSVLNPLEYHYSVRLLDRKEDDQVIVLNSGGFYCQDMKNEFPRLTDTSLGIYVDASFLTEPAWSGSFRLFLYQDGLLMGTEDLMQDITLEKGMGYSGNYSIYSTLPEGNYVGKIRYRGKYSVEWKDLPESDGLVHSYPVTILPPVVSLSADYKIVDGEEYSIPSNEGQTNDGASFSFRYCVSNLNKQDFIGDLALFSKDRQVSRPVSVSVSGERAERKTGFIRLDLSGINYPARLELRARQDGSSGFKPISDHLCRNYAVLQKNTTSNLSVKESAIHCGYDRVREAFVLTGISCPCIVTLYAVDGKMLYHTEVKNREVYLIPVSGYGKGVYIISVNGEGYRVMK